eukprot:218903_1
MSTRKTRKSELMKQSRNKLKKKCKSLKISAEGSKNDMINRILLNDQNNNSMNIRTNKSMNNNNKCNKQSLLKLCANNNNSNEVKNDAVPIYLNICHKLLIERYIKQNYNYNSLKVSIPTNIYCMCILFAFGLYKKIKFSSKYKSCYGLKLSENNKFVTKSNDTHSSWILCNIKPIYKGTICWRVFCENPNKELLTFGISSRKKGKTNKLSHDKIYGISRNNNTNKNYYKPMGHTKTNKIDLKHFIQNKCVIDILLNADKGLLKLCVPGICDDNHEALIYDIPINNKCKGWIPYFYFSKKSKNATLSIIQVDKYWYGKKIINPLIYLENILINYNENKINILNISDELQKPQQFILKNSKLFSNKIDQQQFKSIFECILNSNVLFSRKIAKIIAEYSTGNQYNCDTNNCHNKIFMTQQDKNNAFGFYKDIYYQNNFVDDKISQQFC